MDRLRNWVRRQLGVNDVTRIINIVEARAKTRHTEVVKGLEDQARLSHERYLALAEMLRQFEQRMIMKHIDQPREFTPPVLDWDTVQAIALHDLEKGQ